jgi:hypothetical protein
VDQGRSWRAGLRDRAGMIWLIHEVARALE